MFRIPSGTFGGENSRERFKATGQFRPPRKGEWYLSGARVQAWKAPNDLSTSYWIAVPILKT